MSTEHQLVNAGRGGGKATGAALVDGLIERLTQDDSFIAAHLPGGALDVAELLGTTPERARRLLLCKMPSARQRDMDIDKISEYVGIPAATLRRHLPDDRPDVEIWADWHHNGDPNA